VPPVSDAELDVLKVLWEHGPATVRDVEARLRQRNRRWAYNTVLTLLSRLRDKGHVASDKQEARGEARQGEARQGEARQGEARGGAALVFRAAVSRDDLLRHGLTDLADRMCDGTASPLVHALVQGRQLSPDDIADLRKLLDELERKE
jgi:predicted transcriptional regulator